MKMENREDQINQIRAEFNDIRSVLDERRIRIWCAAKSRAYNRIHKKGGVTIVSEATGVSRPRIYLGISEIENSGQVAKEQIRKQGGGRKKNN